MATVVGGVAGAVQAYQGSQKAEGLYPNTAPNSSPNNPAPETPAKPSTSKQVKS
jgi:hypothetical protein